MDRQFLISGSFGSGKSLASLSVRAGSMAPKITYKHQACERDPLAIQVEIHQNL